MICRHAETNDLGKHGPPIDVSEHNAILFFQRIPRSVDVLSAILWHCFYYTVSGYRAVLHRTVFISSQLTYAFHMPSQSKCKYSPG